MIDHDGKKHMIPNIAEFVKSVNLEEKRIDIYEMKGLIDEY